MLNPQSPIPLYHQLAERIEARIRSGIYSLGERIPAETTLATENAIGRPTVRQAIDQLVRKGLLVRKRGSGTYVQGPAEEVDLFSLGGTMASFHEKGITATCQILEKIHRVRVQSSRENPFSGGLSFFIKRLTSVDDTPVLIEDIYLHEEIFPGLDTVEIAGKSLSAKVMERYGLRPSGGRQVFSIGYPSKDHASLLDLPVTSPVLSVKRYLHFPQADNAVFSELYCRMDRFVFSQQLGRNWI